ncbi:uncharacterized protein LOC124541252 [Vanessa cardui]|uniref:uncharacterized protein LOC124541251 n=1 Tax=Vanessa cardui TaxID=171605 RepID=UPI001F145821|nr:uncharacterized protein LOC124541251 [Vanessa cardui]XP_046975094.1 uncharacterized protein LOC124541252 [Vanessa cardui]
MYFYIQLMTIVIPIIIQQTSQMPVMRYDGKTSLSLGPRHSGPLISEFRNIPLNNKQLSSSYKKKLADEMITVNEMHIEGNTNNKLGSNTKYKLGSNNKSKLGSNTKSKLGSNTKSKLGSNTKSKLGSNTKSKLGSNTKSKLGSNTNNELDSNTKNQLMERNDDDAETYIQFDDNETDDVIKYDDRDKKAEYDAYGKRYYRIPMEDDGNGVRYDMYEDDAGTRYYKVYVIDDRAGYVIINGVRYYPKTRPSIKQSQKPKVPLNQEIYCNTIQNFDQTNVFHKLSCQKLANIGKLRNKFHFRY